MIDIGTAIRHYKRREVQDELILAGQNKEVAARYGDNFGARPDVLAYPKDVLEMAQKGATSFHASEELWSYPMRLGPMMQKAEIEDLRIGWDLVLDIDCAFIEYSKIAADEIVKELKRNSINAVSAKFSGNKGFHIGVPFESFPEKIKGNNSRTMFPEAAREVAGFLRDRIKKNVAKRINETERDLAAIKAKTAKEIPKELVPNSSDTLESAQGKVTRYIESFLNIDTVLISSRHLYRMPYSLHEKSGLVSVPINPATIMEFDKKEAKPENVNVGEFRFLDREKAVEGEMFKLFDNSAPESREAKMPILQKAEAPRHHSFAEAEGAIPKEHWPPCMQKITAGLEDGRKRAVFILINFLSSTGYEYKEIEQIVKDWNSRNKPPLNEPYVTGQLEYYRMKKKRVLPPNCSNDGYYGDMGIKCAEEICSRCKNPVVFAKKKMRL